MPRKEGVAPSGTIATYRHVGLVFYDHLGRVGAVSDDFPERIAIRVFPGPYATFERVEPGEAIGLIERITGERWTKKRPKKAGAGPMTVNPKKTRG